MSNTLCADPWEDQLCWCHQGWAAYHSDRFQTSLTRWAVIPMCRNNVLDSAANSRPLSPVYLTSHAKHHSISHNNQQAAKSWKYLNFIIEAFSTTVPPTHLAPWINTLPHFWWCQQITNDNWQRLKKCNIKLKYRAYTTLEYSWASIKYGTRTEIR